MHVTRSVLFDVLLVLGENVAAARTNVSVDQITYLGCCIKMQMSLYTRAIVQAHRYQRVSTYGMTWMYADPVGKSALHQMNTA